MAKNRAASASQTFPGFEASGQMPDGYYSGDKPNMNLRSFVEEHSSPYDPETDGYDVSAFNEPITTSKVTAIYNMHTYWSKKPHDAIQRYVRHYTAPRDIVLDPFCGSGGTALAALMENRNAIAIDRSPAATFITRSYCTPVDPVAFNKAVAGLKQRIAPELKWLYETRCDRCGGAAATDFTVFSQVFQCPRCLKKVALFDCTKAESRTGAGKPTKVNVCPHCYAKGHAEVIRSQSQKFGSIPVLVSYLCLNGCKPPQGHRLHNDADAKKREFFEKYDLGKIREINSKDIPYWTPRGYDMTGFSRYQRDALFYYEVKEVADLFTKRNLWALAAIRSAAQELTEPARSVALFALTGIVLGMSRMNRYRPDVTYPTNVMSGIYYMPQISQEEPPLKHFVNKLDRLAKGFAAIRGSLGNGHVIISTQCAQRMESIPGNSVDYIFTDPPYADKVQYGELNCVWEAWLGVQADWYEDEIIVNDVRGKSEVDWATRMRHAMEESYRVLKPGRWLSLCYHDTSEGTWSLVQDIMAEVGFVIDKSESTLFIDTGQKSFNQYTADKATKRDLVLNFRKPKPGDWRMTQVFIPADADLPTFQEMGRQLIREFLTAHPGAPKDRIYDELVSRMVRKGQMEAHDFEALLRSVAEEVRQPVKEDLFDNKAPDLIGSHVTSRWYLKETADQIDRAEQEKEDAAAERLETFMLSHLKKSPEQEGVHYSDLFEQYLPVADKPRRLLADWLPEYFFKTTEGTWRPPADDEERQQKAALRGAGTLRRMKRFANALIDGVPVREQDRPANDRTLAEWIRQCRRAGLYEQGRALYEKGGLSLENLTDEEQIAVEDDYRICVKRKGEDESKPKRQRRKRGAEE